MFVTVTAITAKTDTLGVVEVTAAGTTADALKTAITPASTVVAKAGATNVYTVTITGAKYATPYTIAVGTGFSIATGVVAGPFTWTSPDATAPVVTAASSVNVAAAAQIYTFTVVDETNGSGINLSDITATQGTTALTVTAAATPADTYQVSLNAVQGANQTLTINAKDKAGNAATAKTVTLVDKIKPTISSVQSINNKTILVTFSEPMADSALTVGTAGAGEKYSLYNKVNGAETKMSSSAVDKATHLIVTAAFADISKTQIKFTITDTTVAGYPQSGLSNTGYIFYAAATVADRSAAGNTIIAASPYEFTGTLTPDAVGAAIVSSAYTATSGEVVLNFDKAVNEAMPADSKLAFKVGTTTANLLAADYTGATFDATIKTQISFTLSAAGLAKVNALGANPSIVISAGAFVNGTVACQAAESTPTIATGPMLTSVTYDENLNVAVYKFSKTIDVAKMTVFVGNFTLGGLDIYGGAAAGATFQTTANGTDLIFKLSNANAQAVEAAVRGGNLNATVVAGTVKDTETTPNANVGATSATTVAIGSTYTKDTTAPTLTVAKYNADSKVLEIGFNEAVKNTITDYTVASIQLWTDTNGVAGLQTAAAGGVVADTQIATLANTDMAGGAAIGQTGMRADATTGAGAAIVSSEKTVIYIKDQDAAHKLDVTLDAVAAATDIYVNILAGGVKDANTNATTAVQSVKVTKVAVSNTSAITAATTVTSNTLGQVTVAFSNGSAVAMDPTTATVIANYNLYLTSNPLNKVTISSITMNPTNTSAILLLSAPMAASTSYSLKTTGIKTATGKVGDIDGTTIPAIAFNSVAGPDTTPLTAAVAPSLTDVDTSGAISAGDKIALAFNEPVVLPTSFDVSQITVSNTHSLGSSTYALSDDKKTFTITLGSGTTITTADTLTFPTTIKDYEGNALAGGSATTLAMTIVGNTDPKVASAVYTDTNADGIVSAGDTVVVTFDQNVALKATKTAADLNNEFNFAGNVDRVSAVALSGKTATLTLNANAVNADFATNLKTTLGDGDLVNVWDTASADAAGKPFTYTDTTAPKLTAVSYKTTSKELTVTFDEPVNISTATNATDVARMVFGKLAIDAASSLGAIPTTAAVLSTDKKSVTITLAGTPAMDATSVITVTAGGFAVDATAAPDGTIETIKDASGNAAIRNQANYTPTVTAS